MSEPTPAASPPAQPAGHPGPLPAAGPERRGEWVRVYDRRPPRNEYVLVAHHDDMNGVWRGEVAVMLPNRVWCDGRGCRADNYWTHWRIIDWPAPAPSPAGATPTTAQCGHRWHDNPAILIFPCPECGAGGDEPDAEAAPTGDAGRVGAEVRHYVCPGCGCTTLSTDAGEKRLHCACGELFVPTSPALARLDAPEPGAEAERPTVAGCCRYTPHAGNYGVTMLANGQGEWLNRDDVLGVLAAPEPAGRDEGAEVARLTAERDKLHRLCDVLGSGQDLAIEQRDRIAAELDKLAAFKAYVHKRLDDAGVPTDPESTHKAEGCRIGGRLDVVLAAREALAWYADAGNYNDGNLYEGDQSILNDNGERARLALAPPPPATRDGGGEAPAATGDAADGEASSPGGT